MLSRTLFRRSLAPAGRRFIHSPHQSNSKRYIWTHLLAGVAGGLSVVGAGYTYYHFSGIKRAVDASKEIRAYLERTKQSVANKAPSEAWKSLRNLAKSYGVLVPGSGIAIDWAFDSVEPVFEEHRPEAVTILTNAQQEIDDIMKMKDVLTNTELASRILEVIGKHVNEIGRLGGKAATPFLQPVKDRLPDKAYLVEKADQSVGMLKGYFGKRKE